MTTETLQPVKLSSMMHRHAVTHQDKLAVQLLQNGTDPGAGITYAQLYRKARAVAVRLAQEVSPGDRAVLLYPAGPDFVVGFLGCLYAGVIAVPAPAPDAVQFKRSWPRLRAIMHDAKTALILTSSGFEPQLQDMLGESPLDGIQIMLTDEVGTNNADQYRERDVEPQDVAYLQYTSGSVAAPKGVMITHGNLMAHLPVQQSVIGFEHSRRSLTWMPHHHDYGLVQGLLLPLYAGATCYVMSPTSFIRKPGRWLEAISRLGISLSQGTNFAFAYCLRRHEAASSPELDLSCWTAASIGAEPINPDTMRQFERTYLPFGFRPGALIPAYGLAEATLMVTSSRPGAGVTYSDFETRALLTGKAVQTGNQEQRTIIGCGSALGADTRLRIVDPETCRPSLGNEIGEIWVAGPGVAKGYWRRPEETEQTFGARLSGTGEGPFLRTGDLGFVKDEELFVTSRCKDLIIIRGQNHHPQDIEFAVEASHPNLRVGRCAAFSVAASETEQLVVVAELTGRADEALFQAVIGAINAAVSTASELTPDAIVLIRSGSLPVTSSGKVKRQACRDLFVQGGLHAVSEHVQGSEGETTENNTVRATVDREALVRGILASPDGLNDEILIAYFRSVLAETMKSGNLSRLEADQNLSEMGVDSITGVEIRTLIEEDLDLFLPIDLLYQYPTLASMCAFIMPQLMARGAGGFVAQNEQENDTDSLRESCDGPSDGGKGRLLDWKVREGDAGFDLTQNELKSWDRLSLPPSKTSVRKRGMRVVTADWKPKQPVINRDTRVLGMGSCFTRDIMLWLAECGFNRRFPESPYNALLRYPAIGNNAYLAQQFRILSELSDGAAEDVAETHTANRFLDAERDKGMQLHDLLREMDVLILTLGSVETWRDTETGHVLKAPMLLSEYSPQRHQFEVEGFADTLAHLETVDRVAKALFPDLKIIFTLPLGRMATFRPLSALNAACAQDATLRAALFEFLEQRAGDDRLHYYPGYELFSQFFTDPFSADNSHATPYVTGRLCAGFADMFCSAAPQAPAEGSLKDYDPFFARAVAASLNDQEASAGDPEAQSKIAMLEEENQMLKRVCDERLAVIEELDRAVKALQ